MANEKRLIDANAFLKAINERPLDFLDVGGDFGYFDETIDSVMNEQPTVDAVEVVRGRWECTYDAEWGETDVTCSHCKDTRTINGCYVTSTGESCYFEDNYCPNCGAKMDGDGNG